MNKLNGYWRFSYSDEQKEEKIEEADDYVTETYVFVEIEEGEIELAGEYQEGMGIWKEYTEAAHLAHTKKKDYTAHERRYEDSEEIGIIENPKTKQERRWVL